MCDRNQETAIVTATPRRTKQVRSKAEHSPEIAGEEVPAETLITPSEIIVIRSGKRPLHGIKLLVNIAISGYADCIASEPHCHGQTLLSAGAAVTKGSVHVVSDPGQIPQIFQQGKKRKKDRHRRKHDGYDPGDHAINPVNKCSYEPLRSTQLHG